MGRRSRDAGADTSRCTRAEILTDTGAASHRNLAFTALVQVSRPCLLAFLAWVVEHRPTQGPSLQLAPCRCPFRLTNSRLELCYKIWIKSSPDQSWQAFQTGYRLREAMSPKLDLTGIPEIRDTVVLGSYDKLAKDVYFSLEGDLVKQVNRMLWSSLGFL